MKKKTLIATMLVLTLLLLMPSIPAVQQITIKEEIKQDLQGINTLEDDIKHPLLWQWVNFRFDLIYTRALILYFISVRWDYYSSEVIFPLIYFRSIYLEDCAVAYSDFWRGVSLYYDWGWVE